MNFDEIPKMKEAYEKLYIYIIENLLRYYIKKKMEDKYGVNWFYLAPRIVLKRSPKKAFNNLYLHELERVYLRTYTEVFSDLPSRFFLFLHSLYPLRNKIAHCHPLNEQEFNQFSLAYDYIKSILIKELGGIRCEIRAGTD
jgi:hypothetical protein